MVSFSRKIYFSKSVRLAISDLSISVLSFLELARVSALSHTGFVDDLEVVFRWASLSVSALGADVDGLFLFAKSSIFPSDALGGSLGDFPLYPCLCGSIDGSSVTPVR